MYLFICLCPTTPLMTCDMNSFIVSGGLKSIIAFST